MTAPRIHGPDHVPGGPDPIPFGNAVFEIKVFEDDVVLIAGDGRFKFDVPSELDESLLIDVEAWITGVSSSGSVVVSIWNETQGHDMLSSPLTIDAGDLNDKDSGSPFSINTANAEVAYGDELWINVDNAGSGAVGLGVKVAFSPTAVGTVVIAGAKGEPGGVTSFEGDWADTTSYPSGSVVVHDGVAYLSTDDHTSDSSTEPGTGVDWETVWVPLVEVPLGASVNFNVMSSAGAIPDGEFLAVVLPVDLTLESWQLLADQATDAEVDLWASDFAGYPPSSGDSITGGSPATLTGSVKNEDVTLAGWTTALPAGTILVVSVSGVSTARRLTLAVNVVK